MEPRATTDSVVPPLVPKRGTWFESTVAASVVFHLGVALALSQVPPPEPKAELPTVEALSIPFEVEESEPPIAEEPTPAPKPEPEKPAEPTPLAQAPPTESPAAAEQAPADAPPEEAPAETAEPEPIELDGTTLTNDTGDGPGWSARRGSGRDRSGPIRAPRGGAKKSRAPRPVGSSKGKASRPRNVQSKTVAFGDLSSQPRPPSLNGTLRRYYPAEAKRRGIGGSAKVRVRVSSSGVARGVSVLSESFPGFGQACLSTVSGSRWGAPKDKKGKAVATFVVYRCHFHVDR